MKKSKVKKRRKLRSLERQFGEHLKLIKEIGEHCPTCKKKFIKLSKYTYKPNCDHFPENVRVSVG